MRRQALSFLKVAKEGDTASIERTRARNSNREDMELADAPQALAREAGQESWPKSKFSPEAAAMDTAQRAGRLVEDPSAANRVV